MKENLLIIAGPCAIESERQIMDIAYAVKEAEGDVLRGGAFKPRTNPDSFQGLGKIGLKYLKRAGEETGLKTITEVMGTEEISLVSEYVDILQVGSRNMSNYDLLKKIGQRAPEKTVLLKRGMSANKKELFGAIKYLTDYGHCRDIIICERGIRTFANGDYDRFTLDTGLIADLKESNFNYKIIADPSHSAGKKELVEPLAYAGVVAGADGLMLEVKLSEENQPLVDAEQAITVNKMKEIIKNSREISKIVNKK